MPAAQPRVCLMPAARRPELALWALCCAAAGLAFALYVSMALAAGQGDLILPLDDVYIHFQYARQLASGQPFVYNPGQPPTSGATSFLYPFALALGYSAGFTGLRLGLWALALGALALAASAWLVDRLARLWGGPPWLAALLALAFALTGAVTWHYFSGMETGLVTLLALATLYAVAAGRPRLFVPGASLLALARPEWGLLAALAAGALAWRALSVPGAARRRGWWLPLLLPVAMLGVQPAANWLVTGTAVASGGAAKSLFSMVPFRWEVVLARVWENFSRIWAEFLTGYSAREGWYIAPLLALLGLAGVVALLRQRDSRPAAALAALWLLAGTAAVATLDTAFWHFKRYQLPLLALFFPLAGAALGRALRALPAARWPARAYALLLLPFAAATGAAFVGHFALNVGYVYAQPFQMARWLAANTPPDAVIAVHDVGMMRYMGERTTLDMVGLTTPGAAAYWRSGPGAVAEFLVLRRPDYIASYGEGHGFGLGMIAATSIYGEPLAAFPVELDPRYNVALAADSQGIYRPDWAGADHAAAHRPQLPWLRGWAAWDEVDAVNVAQIDSEQAHGYQWRGDARLAAFPTEVREWGYINCAGADCHVLDGGRAVDAEESFTVQAQPGRDLLLATRLHPFSRGTLAIYADGVYVARRWIPDLPGAWLDVFTLIPAAQVTGGALRITVVPDTPGAYLPHWHTVYQGDYRADAAPPGALTTYQDGAITLVSAGLTPAADALRVALRWHSDGAAQGDYKVFVHLLGADGAIAAQADARPGGGALPPGNWLPGTLRDELVVNLIGVPPGRYRAVMGLYDPLTGARLAPAVGGDETAALLIGEVERP